MAHILVVDDDAQVRLTLGEYMTKSGHDVTLASNGADALQLVAARKVDLILIDIIMPEQNGFETILMIAGLRGRPAIIAMSGGSRQLDLDFVHSIAKKLPIEDFLHKPVSFEVLGAAIDRALAQRSDAPGI